MTLVNMFTFNRKVHFSIISKCLSSKSPSVKSKPKTVVKATSTTRNTCFNQESPDMKKVYDISDKITIVRDRSKAESVLKVLYDSKNVIWGCDTEVADIDVKTQGPVGNGRKLILIIFISLFLIIMIMIIIINARKSHMCIYLWRAKH